MPLHGALLFAGLTKARKKNILIIVKKTTNMLWQTDKRFITFASKKEAGLCGGAGNPKTRN